MRTCIKCGESYANVEDNFYYRKDAGNYRKECKRCFREATKMRRERFPEKTKDISNRYYHRHKDAILAKRRDDRIRYNISWHEYYSKSIGVYFNFTVEDWEKSLSYFNNRCAYCGKESDLVIEHVIPYIKGGATVPNNIVPACSSCNGKKGTKDLYAAHLCIEEFSSSRLEKIVDYIDYINEK